MDTLRITVNRSMVRDTLLEIYTIRPGKKLPYVDENPPLYLRVFNTLATVFVRNIITF